MAEASHRGAAGAGREGEPQEAQTSMHHQGDFGNYMHFKNVKLREQFTSLAFDSERASSIFEGVCIHVNGYTDPSHQELKLLMARHGGRFENYFHRQHVTHIVCGNLPDTKLKQLATERKALPIVKPSWVVACVQAGRLLPVDGYRLEATRDHPQQRRLHDFHATSAAPLPVVELYPNLAPYTAPTVAAAPPLPVHNTAPSASPHPPPAVAQASAQQHSSAQAVPLQMQILQHPLPGSRSLLPPGGQALPTAGAGAYGVPLPSSSAAAGTATPAAASVASTTAPAPAPAPAVGAATSIASAQALAADMRAACDVLKGPPRSTRDDPQGFVETFFRSSRLHFIGTWKARIDDLFAATPPGPQPTPYAASLAGERVVVHVDMDCFFAAAAAVGRPELVGVPLAVCHSSSSSGCGEVSTANYEARTYGIRSGMFIAEAKRRCPQLVVVPYEFERYHAISQAMYRLLLCVSAAVQPLSCDEALLDVTGLGDPDTVVQQLRRTIQEQTGCLASAGIGPNPLVARLATAKAKPNGQHRVRPPEVQEFMRDLAVEELPGVGWSTRAKLKELGLAKACQLWAVSRELLQRHLGQKAGAALWDAARGVDARRVERPGPRKSIGAEVNWGVRFDSAADVRAFLERLAAEVAERMAGARVKGRTVTLKVKRKQADAPEPAKFLGHGVCDNLSRSEALPRLTSSAGDLMRCCWALLQRMAIPVDELRGVGITVTRLDWDAAAGKVSAAAAKLFSLPDAKHAGPRDIAAEQQSHPGRAGPSRQQTQAGEMSAGPAAEAVNEQQQQQQQEAGAAAGGMEQPLLAGGKDEDEEEWEDAGVADAVLPAGSVWPGSWVQLPAPPPIVVPVPERPVAVALATATVAGQVDDTGAVGAGREVDNSKGLPGDWPLQDTAEPAELTGRPDSVQLGNRSLVQGQPPPRQEQQQQEQEQPRSISQRALAGIQQNGADAGVAEGQVGAPAGPPVLVESSEQQTTRKQQRHNHHHRHHHQHPAIRDDAAVALPPMSQVDREVLDALPLPLLRELERAYGVVSLQGAAAQQQEAAPHPQQHQAVRQPPDGRAPPAKRLRLSAAATATARPLAAVQDPRSGSLQQAAAGTTVQAILPGHTAAMHPSLLRAAGSADDDVAHPLPAADLLPSAWVFAAEPAAAVKHAIASAVKRLAGCSSCAGSQPCPSGGAPRAASNMGSSSSAMSAQLGVLAELAAQWLVGLLEGDLEEVARGLRLLHRLAGQHAPFAPHAHATAAAVQQYIKQQYGFTLACISA